MLRNPIHLANTACSRVRSISSAREAVLHLYGKLLKGVSLALCVLCLCPRVVCAESELTPSPDTLVQDIVDCLHGPGEFVVDPQDPARRCVEPHKAETKPDLPFKLPAAEIDRICTDHDPRALSGDVVKRVVARANASNGAGIDPTGVRIIGGVYCDQVDLAGLDLKYSLILDKAVFRHGIAARNLRVSGDFSIDDSLVFGTMMLNRARIDGSFYHGLGFIWQEVVSDTKVEGTWHQAGTVVLDEAQFRGLTLSGDLDASDSALGHFSIEASQVRGGLILNNSEARCGYDIRTSDIGYLLAENAGFGTGTITEPNGTVPTDVKAADAYSWWYRFWTSNNNSSRTGDDDGARPFLTSQATRRSVENTPHECRNGGNGDATVRFVVLEAHIKSNLCLRSFRWLRWPSDEYGVEKQPASALILSGTVVDTGLIATFERDRSNSAQAPALREKRTLEAKGLTAGSLTFDFMEGSYNTDLDGLKFGRILTNLTDCEFRSELPTGARAHSGTSDRPQPPSVEQVVTWLDRNKNKTKSSQAFTAFADAFEGIGEDATSLRVARATQDLRDKTDDWLNARPFPFGASFDSFHATFFDSMPLAFGWGLRAVADHGFRPGNVVYWVLGTLFVFWLIFWFGLKIVAFEPEEKQSGAKGQSEHGSSLPKRSSPRLLPIGFLFLFDRLIPAVEIREENYSIGNVYRRASPVFRWPWKKRWEPNNKNTDIYKMKYLGRTHFLVLLDEQDKDRLKRWLIAVRVIGVVWGVFLLAALNALIKH
jgi:hypothetical protein